MTGACAKLDGQRYTEQQLRETKTIPDLRFWWCAPPGFRTPDPLIKSGRFSLLPAQSGRVPYSVGLQRFAYIITSCRGRPIPVDCVSFATHKRHPSLFAMANLLVSHAVRRFISPQGPGAMCRSPLEGATMLAVALIS